MPEISRDDTSAPRAATQHDNLTSWLMDAGSMTQRLQTSFSRLQFKLLAAGPGPVLAEECETLSICKPKSTWVRTILFCTTTREYLFSRVVIPPQTMRAHGNALAMLGAQPLGAVIFTHHDDQRTHISVSRLARSHPYVRAAERYCVASLDTLLIRRSICYYQNSPMLINDMFLPNLMDHIYAN